jgi:hypothetical protein
MKLSLAENRNVFTCPGYEESTSCGVREEKRAEKWQMQKSTKKNSHYAPPSLNQINLKMMNRRRGREATETTDLVVSFIIHRRRITRRFE